MDRVSQPLSMSNDQILDIPIPPVELRELVGITNLAFFDNTNGENVLPLLGERSYGEIFDFGCGCGRLARQFLLQNPRPKRYVGLDLHAGMIAWCRENLEPIDRNFHFIHSDVYNKGFNPQADVNQIEFPVESKSFDALVAHSVFTHLLESTAMFYLQECARIIKPQGACLTTWFLFDKADFPMMQTFQNALYINEEDPTNAVIFDRSWLKMALAEVGLVITHVQPPYVKGFQWELLLQPVETADKEVDLGEDLAPRGHVPPPVLTVPAYRLGSENNL